MSEVKSSLYSAQMRLLIKDLQDRDFGGYKCISKNSLGDAEGSIHLYREYFFFDGQINFFFKGKQKEMKKKS